MSGLKSFFGDPASRVGLALVALVGPAFSDEIVGRVVDAQGLGVAGVDIDARNLGAGDDPTLMNDGTDVNGFFATTLPAGEYRLSFTPPAPPTTTHLVLELDDVTVSGTTDLGILSLPAGVGLAGRALDPSGTPVAGIDIDIIDEVLGQSFDPPGDFTDAFGRFLIAVPPGPIRLRMDATPVVSQTLASREFELEPTTGTDLGDLAFQRGYLVTALVRNGASGVEGVDVDTVHVGSGEGVYTPGDDTDSLGLVDFVVPAGVYRFEFCPPFATQLAPVAIEPVAVSAGTSLGLVQLEAGVILSGTVQSSLGPVGDVDIDVEDTTSGSEELVCNDQTTPAGTYAVVVRPGNYAVEFSPPFTLPLGLEVVTPVSVFGNTIVDAMLPDCPFGIDIGGGSAGSSGVPQLAATSAPRLGNDAFRLAVSGGPANASCLVLVSLGMEPPVPFPFRAGMANALVRLVDWDSARPLGVILDGAGSGSASLPIAANPGTVGLTLRARAYVRDTGVPAGFSVSNGIAATICN